MGESSEPVAENVRDITDLLAPRRRRAARMAQIERCRDHVLARRASTESKDLLGVPLPSSLDELVERGILSDTEAAWYQPEPPRSAKLSRARREAHAKAVDQAQCHLFLVVQTLAEVFPDPDIADWLHRGGGARIFAVANRYSEISYLAENDVLNMKEALHDLSEPG